MLRRRAVSIQYRNASKGRSVVRAASIDGSRIWLEIIIAKVTAATITIPVAADAPPIKAKIAKVGLPSAKGRLMTNESGTTEEGRRN